MRGTMAVCAAVITACMCAQPLQAHHSGFMYQTTPIWIKGTVVAFDNVSPHSLITLEDRSGAGPLRRWVVEGPADWQLERMGMSAEAPNVGDVLEFCAFPYKSPEELSRAFPGVDLAARRALQPADGSSPQYLAGHVMVLPDGAKRVWEPHGLLVPCVLTSAEPRDSWLELLNSSPRAHDAWCEQRRRPATWLPATAEERGQQINAELDEPCP